MKLIARGLDRTADRGDPFCGLRTVGGASRSSSSWITWGCSTGPPRRHRVRVRAGQPRRRRHTMPMRHTTGEGCGTGPRHPRPDQGRRSPTTAAPDRPGTPNVYPDAAEDHEHRDHRDSSRSPDTVPTPVAAGHTALARAAAPRDGSSSSRWPSCRWALSVVGFVISLGLPPEWQTEAPATPDLAAGLMFPVVGAFLLAHRRARPPRG